MRNEKDKKFMKDMLRTQKLVIANLLLLLPATAIYAILMALFCTGELLAQYFTRGGGTSGGSYPRIRSKLMKVAAFRRFVLTLENNCKVCGGWVFGNLSGRHPPHGDSLKEGATHRQVHAIVILIIFLLIYLILMPHFHNRMIVTFGGRRVPFFDPLFGFDFGEIHKSG